MQIPSKTEDASKTDLMYEVVYNPDFVPTRSPKVTVKTTSTGGKISYLMKNHASGVYYEPDELTNLIWTVIDGKRTVKQITEEVQKQKPKVKEDDVTGILLFFAEASLLVSKPEQLKNKRFKVVSAFEMDYTIINQSKKFLGSIHNRLRPLLKRSLLWATVIFILLGAVLFATRFVSIFGNKSNFQILGSTAVGFFFYYFVALAPVIAIHEIAHGLALVHYGGEPGEMGTGIFYFGPMFYTETTDVWTIEKKHRIMVFLAGNITTLSIGSIFALLTFFVNFPQPAGLILTMVAFYCFNMSLFNFAPPFETDGYYVLSDSLDMPNLRHESYGYVGSLFRRILGKRTKPKTSDLTRRRKWIFVTYAAVSIGWIAYIVFETSLFLSYMGQDIMNILSNIFHGIWALQAVPASIILIAILSVLYFGMQVLGYGSLFLAAAKKATKKPLRIEAIPDRVVSVFAYLPPQTPEALSNELRTKMDRTARKFTHNSEVKQIGRSCSSVLRMGSASLAFSEIKNDLRRVEEEFSSIYERLILEHRNQLERSFGLMCPEKVKMTKLLEQLASESADSGNSGAVAVINACKEKQKETILYLLTSSFGTVWTIEVQPAHEYEIQKEIVPEMLLHDLSLTDLYGDCENFKKRTVYGFDSLVKLAEETEAGLKESLAQPQQYQLVGVFEPIRSRITFIGRTEELEGKIDLFGPYFLAETWSGYVDNLLTETCYTIDALNRTQIPGAKEIKEMSIGEIVVLAKDLSAFEENRELVNACLQTSEKTLSEMNQNLNGIRDAIRPSGGFEIGLLDAAFNVNSENLEAIPARIQDFRKEWTAVCRKLDRIGEHVTNEYEKRKNEIQREKRRILKAYVPVMIVSIIIATLGFVPPFDTFRLLLFSITIATQVAYWLISYSKWRSFHKVSKYPSEVFSRIHLLLLAWGEAIYSYVSTADVLVLP